MKRSTLTFRGLAQGAIIAAIAYGGLYLCAVVYYSNPDNIDTPTMRNARRLGNAVSELDRITKENEERYKGREAEFKLYEEQQAERNRRFQAEMKAEDEKYRRMFP